MPAIQQRLPFGADLGRFSKHLCRGGLLSPGLLDDGPGSLLGPGHFLGWASLPRLDLLQNGGIVTAELVDADIQPGYPILV
jgi:hypothetical protein